MRWFRQLEFRLLWPFYISQIIQSIFLLTAAYWTVYFLSLGYSLAQISLLPTAMLLTRLIFEIPTGFIADWKGRKQTVVASIFLGAVCTALIPFVGLHLKLLIALYALMGFGAALASGAGEAWVVDFIHWHAKPSAIPHYYATLHSFINVGFIAAPLFASAIIFLTGALHYLWWIEGAMFFGAGFILVLFGKEKKVEQERSNLTASMLWRRTITEFRECPTFALLSLVMFLLAVIFGVTTLAWQPFLITKGVPLAWFGILFAFTGILAITYPAIQKMASVQMGNRRLLQLISIIQMIAFGILSITPFVGVIILFFVLQNLDSIKIPIFQPWFQEHMPSVARSTFGSIMAMVGAVGEGVGYLIAGQLAGVVSINAVWLFTAGLSALTVFVLAQICRLDQKYVSGRLQ